MWSEVRPPTTTQVLDAFGVEMGELRLHPGDSKRMGSPTDAGS
jgi:hypothetical protein